MPRVSLIVPTFNGERFISRFVACIDRQTFRDLELVFIDDASTDRTAAACVEVASVSPRRVLHTDSNLGPSVARNLGLSATDSEFVAIVDVDDLIHPERLARLISLAIDTRADWVADDQIFVDASSFEPLHLLWGRQSLPADEFALARALLTRSGVWGRDRGGFATMKPLFRRQALLVGNLSYDESLRSLEDLDLYFRCCLHSLRFRWESKPGYYYLLRGREADGAPRGTDDMVCLQRKLEMLVAEGHAPGFEALVRHRGRLVRLSQAFFDLLSARHRGVGLLRWLAGHSGLLSELPVAVVYQIFWRIQYQLRTVPRRSPVPSDIVDYRDLLTELGLQSPGTRAISEK